MTHLITSGQRGGDAHVSRGGRILQTYLDGELNEARVAMVTAHLEHCRRRGRVADTYERIKESLARVARQGLIHPMDQLSIERLRRFADTLCA